MTVMTTKLPEVLTNQAFEAHLGHVEVSLVESHDSQAYSLGSHGSKESVQEFREPLECLEGHLHVGKLLTVVHHQLS